VHSPQQILSSIPSFYGFTMAQRGCDMSDPTPIYTVGYGQRSIEDLLAVLRHYQIHYLIDIRSAPYSRFKPEFSKATLERVLRQHNVRYLFMGDTLGGRPDDPSCYSDGKVDYEKVKEKAFYREGIERLRRAFQQQQRIVLMCSEGKPDQCHRSKLIGASLDEQDIPVIHINEVDEPVSQSDVILDLTGGQLSLFGEPTFTSRQRYHQQDENEKNDSR
jgi:uncharacterized protein (DUF488 family)